MTMPPVDVSSLYGGAGWPTSRGSIYFGGDDGIGFRDFVVNTVPEPSASGLLLLIVIPAACDRRRSVRRDAIRGHPDIQN